MQLQLDSAARLRKNWDELTPQQIQAMIDSGEVDIIFKAITNMTVDYRTYFGHVDVQSFYRYVATGETIIEKEVIKIPVSPETAYLVAGLVVSREPAVQAWLFTQNGGAMPEIKPPIIPEPVPVEIPADPEEPTNPEP